MAILINKIPDKLSFGEIGIRPFNNLREFRGINYGILYGIPYRDSVRSFLGAASVEYFT